MAYNFGASNSYGASFDEDTWRPAGINPAITSDTGLRTLVDGAKEAWKEEGRLAGQAFDQYGSALQAKDTADTEYELAKIRHEQMEDMQSSSGSGGGSSGLGTALGVAKTAASFIPGVGPAISGISGLFS